MASPLPLAAALQSLEARWGAAAPRSAGRRVAGETLSGFGHQVGESMALDDAGAVIGALATVPLPLEQPVAVPPSSPSIIRTGFAALDAILGPGGLPRAGSVAVRGDGSSGTTTLALRLLAEAQTAGGIVGYVDLARSFDPIEAVARGIRLEWLVLLTPGSLDEGLSMAGALLRARIVDVLVLDLPGQGSHVRPGRGRPDGRNRPPRSLPGVGERLRRLTALARNADALLVVIEPPGLPRSLGGALEETVGIRLELARRAWIRLGRDVVGQRTEVVVARNRSGPPGRRAELRILYADGGDRDACLRDEGLLHERPSVMAPPAMPPPGPVPLDRTPDRILFPSRALTFDATSPPALAAPPAPIGAVTAGRDRDDTRGRLRLVPGVPDRPGRTALERRGGPRCQPGGPGARGATRAGAGERTSPGP